MGSMFVPAQRRKLKLRMAICSPAGYGKSYTGLIFSQALAEISKTKIAAIDTEYGSLKKHIGHAITVPFDVCEPAHFAPSALTAILREAGAAGYGVVLIDGLSPFWAGKGGALQQVDDKKAAAGGNSFTAWKDVSPQHAEMVEAMLAYPGHVIVTMRTKAEYILEEETRAGGRKVMVPKKVGMAPVQREGMDYEFDIVCDLDEQHTLIVGKTRCPAIDGQRVVKPGPEFLRPVLAWLDEGVIADAAPKFQQAEAPPAAAASSPTTASGIQSAASAAPAVPDPTKATTTSTPTAPASTKSGPSSAAHSATPTSDPTMTSGVASTTLDASKIVQPVNLATLEQTNEIRLILNTLQLKGQPQAIYDSRKITDLAQLKADDAAGILTKLRPKYEEYRAKQQASGQTVVSPVPTPTTPEFPDRVGTIDKEDEKRIKAGLVKLKIDDANLKRIINGLAKIKPAENNVNPQAVPSLSFNQGREFLRQIVARMKKDFPDETWPNPASAANPTK